MLCISCSIQRPDARALLQIRMTFKNHELLRGVNWDVKRGERVGLVGESVIPATLIMKRNWPSESFHMLCSQMARPLLGVKKAPMKLKDDSSCTIWLFACLMTCLISTY